MRVAVFVAVVVAHLIAFLLFPSLWRRESRDGDTESAPVPIFLPPLVAMRPEPKQQRRSGNATPNSRGPHPTAITPAPDWRAPQSESIAPAPDWRAQAEDSAQTSAQHIVEAEDTAKQQANALVARFRPLAPDRVRGPQFGWNFAATHRISPLPGGGFVYSFNDHCQLVIFPLPFVGCVVGKIEANGDLFKDMHPPVKFGDWDKRVPDP